MKRASLLFGALVMASASAASGNPPIAVLPPRVVAPVPPPAAPPVVRIIRPHKPKAPPPPSAPAAAVTLHVTPGAFGTPWTYELTNTDTQPLRVMTDPRLLMLDVTRPPAEGSKAKPVTVHCSLPSEVHPSDDEKARVILPTVTFVETFDPRQYCFAAGEALVLVPGAEVVARLGWVSTGTSPPFVADQIDGGEARSGVKELKADAVTVPDEVPEPEGEAVAPHTDPLAVSTSARIDSEHGRQLDITVTVENTTSRAVRLMLRPETLTFQVASPRGVHECASKKGPGAPIAEVVTTLPAHGKTSTDVLLAALCPDGVVDAAGLYTVRAGIDTRRTSGRSLGMQLFEGRVVATKPSLVRVRWDKAPRP